MPVALCLLSIFVCCQWLVFDPHIHIAYALHTHAYLVFRHVYTNLNERPGCHQHWPLACLLSSAIFKKCLFSVFFQNFSSFFFCFGVILSLSLRNFSAICRVLGISALPLRDNCCATSFTILVYCIRIVVVVAFTYSSF